MRLAALVAAAALAGCSSPPMIDGGALDSNQEKSGFEPDPSTNCSSAARYLVERRGFEPRRN